VHSFGGLLLALGVAKWLRKPGAFTQTLNALLFFSMNGVNRHGQSVNKVFLWVR